MKAQAILQCAISVMEERAKQYDKPEGERSVPAVVDAFNAIKGSTVLTPADGWLILVLLKLVRAQTAKSKALFDSVEDATAYAALMGEEMLAADEPFKVGPPFEGDPADSAFTVRVGDITMSNEAFMRMMDERRAGSVHRSDTGEAVAQEELSRRAVDELVIRGIAKPERIVTNTGQVVSKREERDQVYSRVGTCEKSCKSGEKCPCDPEGLA